jgi:hypothetical protein
VLDEIVSGKFKILNNPMALPAKCAFCGIGHNDEGRRRFIDTSLDLDFYGVVYMCTTCLNEIAESLGYISNDKWNGLKLKLDHIRDENELVKAENDGLRDAVNILTGHRCYYVEPIPERSNEPEVPTADNPEFTSGTPEGIEPKEPKPDSPNSKSGLSDVRGTSEPKPKPSSAKPAVAASSSDDIEF